MGIDDMTPEELRELAAKKEAIELHCSHIGADADPRFEVVDRAAGRREPWEREVEVDGVRYTVDMRRFKSRKFMHMAVRANDDSATLEQKLELFDYVFEPMERQILAEVERRVGYEDFEAYYDICGKIFEAVEAKN